MKSKKIIFVFRNMGTGGAQKIEAFVANTMLEQGAEVIAINMSSNPCTVNLSPKIRIVNVIYDKVDKCNNKILKILYKLYYLFKLRKMILSLKPDLVCAFLSDIVRITVLAMKGCNIPIIGSERGDPHDFTKKQFENYRKAYMKCKGVVFQLENVAKEYNLPNNIKQKVIPNPCIPRKDSYSIRHDSLEHKIVSAGRFTEQKRFDLLVDAFEIVYKEFPNYKLYIYGDGPLYNQVELQIKNSLAASSIVLAGDVSDVFELAADSEFFVLSSDFEGIPNVLLEAMAIGIPCISTDCSPGGARYLLKNGERGIIVPCNDKEKLAEAMISYIKNPDLRLANGKKGIAIKSEFSSEIIKEMWLDIFREGNKLCK